MNEAPENSSASSSSAVAVPTVAAGTFRVFKRLDGGSLYVASVVGISYHAANDGDFEGQSEDFGSIADLEAAAAVGELEELILPSTLASRLSEATKKTGFALGDLVLDDSEGDVGRVIGYGRVNDVTFQDGNIIIPKGGEPSRVVILEGVDGSRWVADADNLSLLAPAPETQPA